MKEAVHDIKLGCRNSAYAEGVFDTGLLSLSSSGLRGILPKEYAELALVQGFYSEALRKPIRTASAVLHLPDKRAFFCPNYFTYQKARNATTQHGQNQEIHVSPAELEGILKNAVRISNGTEQVIPTDRFGEDETTAPIFSELAGSYGLLLKSSGVDNIRAWLARSKKKPFVRPLELWGAETGFCHIFDDGLTSHNPKGLTRGYKNSSEEAGSLALAA